MFWDVQMNGSPYTKAESDDTGRQNTEGASRSGLGLPVSRAILWALSEYHFRSGCSAGGAGILFGHSNDISVSGIC